ncbi:hypothetical protein BDV19DRAFT_394661 [Aspergillus venezuelensis]
MPPLSVSSRSPTDELDLFISDSESENEFEYRSIPSCLYTISEESCESVNENKAGAGAGTMILGRGRDEMDTQHDAEEKAAQSSADVGPREDHEQMDLDNRNEDMVGDEDRKFDLAMILAGARIGDAVVYRVPTVETDDEGQDEGSDGAEDDGGNEGSRGERAVAQALERG